MARQSMFGFHDRRRVRVYGYALSGDEGSPERCRPSAEPRPRRAPVCVSLVNAEAAPCAPLLGPGSTGRGPPGRFPPPSRARPQPTHPAAAAALSPPLLCHPPPTPTPSPRASFVTYPTPPMARQGVCVGLTEGILMGQLPYLSG